jgi:uncharacterized protein YqgC (DUF456 family)
MDTIFIILSVILLIIGVAGTVVPVLPGVPLCWTALLMLKFTSSFGDNISWTTLIVLGVFTLIISILDNLLPLWGTKQMGGNKYVVWGATIGLLFGFFLGLPGIIFGPFVGAFIGGMLSGSKFTNAVKHAVGAFIGFVMGLTLKLITVGLILFFYVKTLL